RVKFRGRTLLGGGRSRQGPPGRSAERLAVKLQSHINRAGTNAIEIGPILVEHDVRRITGNRQGKSQSGRREIDGRLFAGLLGLPHLNCKRHRQSLRSLFEGEQRPMGLIQWSYVLLPTVGGQRLP